MNKQEHPLSFEALIRVILVLVGAYLVWKALGTVIIIIVSLVLAVSLYPLVEIIRKKLRTPLLLSILFAFLILFIPFIIIGATIIPSLNTQLPELITQINTTITKIPFISESLSNFDIREYAQSNYASLANFSVDIILAIVSIITSLVLTFYFIYDHERLLKLFLDIIPVKERARVNELLLKLSKVISQYIRGNVVVSIIDAVIIFIGLFILGIPFALPLAVFSGILDLLPLVGATIGAIPALLIAFSISPIKGLLVLILFVVYQQVENAVVSPAIYNKALNLYPALIFLAIILGTSLFGILGAFLALPIAAIIPTLIEYRKTAQLEK